MNEVRTAIERAPDARVQVQPVSHQTVAGPGGTGRTWPSRVLGDMIAMPTGSTVVPIPGRRTR
jgi:hypothetical protein